MESWKRFGIDWDHGKQISYQDWKDDTHSKNSHKTSSILCLFKMHREVAEKVDWLSRNFLWNHIEGKQKIHGIDGTVCLPKSLGVLASERQEMIISLLGKWLWRFSSDSYSLWRTNHCRKIWCGRKIEKKKPFKSKNKSLWKKIWLNNESFWENISYQLSTGENQILDRLLGHWKHPCWIISLLTSERNSTWFP